MQAARDFSHYVRDLGSGLSHIDLAVEGVSCAGCMSKIERGRIRLDFEEIDLNHILADALRVVSARAHDTQLAVKSRIADGLTLHADRRALKQIMLNLLSNAVKFTPDGGKMLVRGRQHDDHATICIMDTGIGIAKDALAKLGRPFEQVANQHTRNHQGSGLGLAIAKSLVELHGGTMRLRSTPGRGTVVRVHLPVEPNCRLPRTEAA